MGPQSTDSWRRCLQASSKGVRLLGSVVEVGSGVEDLGRGVRCAPEWSGASNRVQLGRDPIYAGLGFEQRRKMARGKAPDHRRARARVDD
jgi:hypothetical protein